MQIWENQKFSGPKHVKCGINQTFQTEISAFWREIQKCRDKSLQFGNSEISKPKFTKLIFIRKSDGTEICKARKIQNF